MRTRLIAWLPVLLLAAGCAGVSRTDMQILNATADAAAPSLVRVEYTFQSDKGDDPEAGALPGADPEDLIREERPFEIAGYLVAPTKVVTTDPGVHPRFLRSISVRFGSERVPAKPAAWSLDRDALVLDLERPLPGAKPLSFDAGLKAPYLLVTHGERDGAWTIDVEPLPAEVFVSELGRRSRAGPRHGLVVNRDARPVGIPMGRDLPTDDGWKGSPLDWLLKPAAAYAADLAALESRARGGILRVTLGFRSPKKDAGSGMSRMRGRFAPGEDGEDGTDKQVLGVVVDAKRVLVLSDMPPVLTARLERITLNLPDGKRVSAKFAGTLREYGALLAEAESPLSGAIGFSPRSADSIQKDLIDSLLLAAEFILQGERVVTYFNHQRIASFDLGWRRQVYPGIRTRSLPRPMFLFDKEGSLLVLPIIRREKVSEGRSGGQQRLTLAAYLREALADPSKHTDPGNIPLSEGQEQRLAWIGTILQPLDRELARAKGVSELTQDGSTGAIVSFVYPDSPAAKAGIGVGDVLLRLHVEGEPKPLEVIAGADDFFGGEGFPWSRLDEIPERVFDRIPAPWPATETPLTRALTDLGFGKKFVVEVFRGGKVEKISMEIAEGPPHYGSAPRSISKPLGLTVRDLTYEVRNYCQMKPDDPGVVVSRIEPGSKASVAGMKPFEIITHVDDKPILSAAEFGKAADAPGQGDRRFGVKRMTMTRTVKIKMGSAAPKGKEPPKAEPPKVAPPKAESPKAEPPKGDELPLAPPPPEPAKEGASPRP